MMTNDGTDIAQQAPTQPGPVQQGLEQQLTLTDQLLNLLSQEQTALTHRDAEQIVELAAQKQQLLEHLANTDKSLQNQLVGKTLPPALEALKEQVQSQLQQCMQQNTINGKAIELSLGSLNRLQNALIKQRSGNSMTYDGKGKTTGSGSFGKSITA